MWERFYRVLLWPVISLLITGGLHFVLEAIWPDLRAAFIPPTLAPLVLAYGAWVGHRMIEAGGGYGGAIVAGAILGVLPIVLETVGFGLILGHGLDAGVLGAAFAFSMIVFGTLLGAGVALTRTPLTDR